MTAPEDQNLTEKGTALESKSNRSYIVHYCVMTVSLLFAVVAMLVWAFVHMSNAKITRCSTVKSRERNAHVHHVKQLMMPIGVE